MATQSADFNNHGKKMKFQWCVISLLALAPLAAWAAGGPPANMQHYLQTGQLNFLDQTTCFTAIERVYYNHRLWPSSNPTPKPTFEQMSAATNFPSTVGDAVKDFNDKERELLRKTGMPTVAQIQAENIRIVKQTQDAAMLRELYAAVSNDPQLFSACISEPALVNRLYLEAQASGALAGNAVVQPTPPGALPAFTVPEISAANCAAWSPVRSGAPQQRYQQVAVWTGAEMIVWGGSDNNPLNTGGRYNPALDDWLPTPVVAGQTPGARHNASAVWTGTQMIIWGGYRVNTNGTTTFLNDGGRYDPRDNRWAVTSMGTDVPEARYAHSAVWTGTEMIIWGGVRCGNPSGGCTLQPPLHTGGRYNPSSDSWTPTSISANVPSARSSHSAVWTGSEMIVWGGINSIAGYETSGGRYNPGYVTMEGWRPTCDNITTACPSGSDPPPAARVSHTAVWTGSKMIVWGGITNGAPFNSGGIYDPMGDSWIATSMAATANVPAARIHHTAVWDKAHLRMIVWGGDNNTGTSYQDGGRFDPAPSSNSWQTISTGANVPTPRFSHTAVWDDYHHQMIIWGGNQKCTDLTCGGNVNSGGRYDPASDSWQTTYQGLNVPTKRSGHTAVWTGSEMVVWGVKDSNAWKYQPVMNDWVKSCGSNATPSVACNGQSPPAVRSGHSAIWTGTDMIVWGGLDMFQNPSRSVNSGGKYNVSNDSWSATTIAPQQCTTQVTTENVPAGRGGHSAVWSGSEMIIFGGGVFDGFNDLGDLKSWGRYNPSSSDWACKPCNWDTVNLVCRDIPNIPSQRVKHTAVWSGAQMLVWGGNCSIGDGSGTCDLPEGEGDRASGSRFTSGDSWAPTSIAPSARSQHTAVWTGNPASPLSSDRMIIWGGTNGDSSGGRYAPGANSWTSTTTFGAPAARFGHTAVWTGTTANSETTNRMIVWGGQGTAYSGCNSSPTSDSIYCDTGGLYAQSPESWSPTVTGGFSSQARAFHTAVWTQNDNMIVWGGRDAIGELSSGGIYSPSGIFISQQPPATLIACAGRISTINVAAFGSGLSYRWRKDGVQLNDDPGCATADEGIICGVTTPTLTINYLSPLPSKYIGLFTVDVEITGSCGSILSTPVALDIYSRSRACPD